MLYTYRCVQTAERYLWQLFASILVAMATAASCWLCAWTSYLCKRIASQWCDRSTHHQQHGGQFDQQCRRAAIDSGTSVWNRQSNTVSIDDQWSRCPMLIACCVNCESVNCVTRSSRQSVHAPYVIITQWITKTTASGPDISVKNTCLHHHACHFMCVRSVCVLCIHGVCIIVTGRNRLEQVTLLSYRSGVTIYQLVGVKIRP